MVRIRRPRSVDTFMNIAIEWSRRSTCSSRISVGAVLVNRYNQVIASGYNGSPRDLPHCDEEGCVLDNDGHCTSSIHAEENAIIQCAINGVPTRGCTLYVTHSPCPRCCLRIIQAGITDVVYQREYKDIREADAILTKGKVRLRAYQ